MKLFVLLTALSTIIVATPDVFIPPSTNPFSLFSTWTKGQADQCAESGGTEYTFYPNFAENVDKMCFEIPPGVQHFRVQEAVKCKPIMHAGGCKDAMTSQAMDLDFCYANPQPANGFSIVVECWN